MNLFRELTEHLPRQAPGSAESTLRALGMTRGLPPRPRILDLGCGPGTQTIELARATGGSVVALDIREHFLDELRERARAAGVDAQITPLRGSMFEMNLEAESFDLIWSEGAIYIIGFGAGLSGWQQFLKSNGWLAVSELSWLTSDPPAVARQFWAQHYPGMRTREENCAIASQAGYLDLQTFVLPLQDWWNYYGPGEQRVGELRIKYANDAAVLAQLEMSQREYDVFRACSDSYSYVFYVMRKPGR